MVYRSEGGALPGALNRLVRKIWMTWQLRGWKGQEGYGVPKP